MRKHVALPTVLSVLALIVAMSGTAAAVTRVLIKHNSQVAAHTIAGANAPSGDKKNIIPGSLGSSDLHSGAVTNSKIGSNAVRAGNIGSSAVTNSKLANHAVTAAKLGFPTFDVTQLETDDTERALVSDQGLTVTYRCAADFNDPQLRVSIFSAVAGAFETGEINDIDNSTTTTLHAAVPSSAETLTAAGSDAGTSENIVTLTYQAGTHVSLLTLDATTNNLTDGGICTVRGAYVRLT